MNRHSDFPLPLVTQPLPAPAPRDVPLNVPAAVPAKESASAEMRGLLARLVGDESALYAITRDWRYDIAGRKFTRLRALLDEQFTEIGARLVKLAAHNRALDVHNLIGRRDRAQPSHAGVDDGALEAHILREALGLHEALLGRLQAGRTIAADQLHDSETTVILADLIADHEKDAFMLRALLWEVQNTAA